MSKNIVIVESPAKGRTIEKYLGENYQVLASFGHIRDLPKSKIGVDAKNNFTPTYEIPQKAKKVVKKLKEEIQKAENLYLATDYDREGEAIAWHLVEAIKPKNKPKRITFHEITKPAIEQAIKNPREIDINLVDAQQARRILDRLVGYKLSPFLWSKVAQGLSAGRVQSVTLRLIVEREAEIKKFKPEEYWTIEVILSKEGEEFKAALTEKDDKKIAKLEVNSEKEAQEYLKDLKDSDYKVADLKQEEKRKYPLPPFTTSTLQQEAGSRFSYSAKQTMRLAQNLYEDGLITYMRTDSVQVSKIALEGAAGAIKKQYGSQYALESPRYYKTKTKNVQEAHEAIRPTGFNVIPDKVNKTSQHAKLYDLIYRRMMASQMKEAIVDEVNVKIKAKNFGFSALGSKIKFDGFLRAYGNNRKENFLPSLKIGDKLNLEKLEKLQHFTEPPARFTEGTLVKELEKRGIGRPSTYAPTISTIQDRGYVDKIEGRFIPKDVGIAVSDILIKHFPKIVDYDFTKKMEDDLDNIASGKLKWQPVINDFYTPFSKNLSEKMKNVDKKQLEEKTEEKCPNCGKFLVIKLGRFGKFMACSGFPDCKYTKPLLEEKDKKSKEINNKIKEKCPDCGQILVLKESNYGPFLACPGYPKCKYTKTIEIEAKIKCPNCGGKLLRKNTKKRKFFWGCAKYPKCKTAFWDEPQKEPCPNCKGVTTFNDKTKLLKCSQCDFKETKK